MAGMHHLSRQVGFAGMHRLANQAGCYPGLSVARIALPGTTLSTTSMPVLPGFSRRRPAAARGWEPKTVRRRQGGRWKRLASAEPTLATSCSLHYASPVSAGCNASQAASHTHCRRPAAAWRRARPPPSPAAGPAAAPVISRQDQGIADCVTKSGPAATCRSLS